MKAWAMLCAFLLAGCLASDPPPAGDAPAPAPEDPVFTLPETITGMDFLASAETAGVAGLWLHEDKAYLSGGGGVGLRIFDISDPAHPLVLANETADVGNSRDVDILEHPNGRLYAVMSSGGVDLIDVTDPTQPSLVSTASVSSHNMAVVPNTTIVYNSRSISAHVPGAGETGQIDIIDFADPENPVVTVFAFPAVIMDPTGVPRPVASTTCHDMTFNEERKLGYCAGVTDTQIWDISDPLDPRIVQVIDWPGTNIHHGVWDARGGDVLILGDEFGGVITPSPPCSSTVRDPTSALWFFDISDLATPTPIGYFQIQHDQVGGDNIGPWPYCSTHFGTLIEDRDMLVMGWYSAGTVLVDFSGLSATNPDGVRQVAHYYSPGTNTWEARYHNGHVYTGDTAHGMEILRLT